MSEPAVVATRPPELAGDVTIARFSAASVQPERWRVSVAGHNHFLTDAATAHRIHALAVAGMAGGTYEAAYGFYVDHAVAPVEPMAHFVAWCETHRVRLQQLATTPDGHALRLRFRLLPGEVCGRWGARLQGLFAPSWMAVLWPLALLTLAAFFLAAPAGGNASFWPAAALALLGVLVHEIGHITACVRHRAVQGGIGVGLYWIWPAFYADVRGSWALASRDRLQVSLGGLYFQSLYAASLAVAGMATGSATLGLALAISMLLMATTLNPVLKYDGYWILSDWLDVTNLHTRIATHLKSLRRARADEWRALARSRWTWISMLFALLAVAYIGFVFTMLLRGGAAAATAIPGSWASARAFAPAGFGHAGPWFAWTRLGGELLQLAFIVFGLVVLGVRSLRATLGLVATSSVAP